MIIPMRMIPTNISHPTQHVVLLLLLPQPQDEVVMDEKVTWLTTQMAGTWQEHYYNLTEFWATHLGTCLCELGVVKGVGVMGMAEEEEVVALQVQHCSRIRVFRQKVD